MIEHPRQSLGIRSWSSGLALLALGAGGCAHPSPAFAPSTAKPAVAELGPGVMARVGACDVSATDLAKRASIYGKQYPDTASASVEGLALEQMIDECVERQFAATEGVVVSDADVTRAMQVWAKSTGKSGSAFVADRTAWVGIEPEAYREVFRRELLDDALVARFVVPRVRVTDEDLERTYVQSRDRWDPVVKFHMAVIRGEDALAQAQIAWANTAAGQPLCRAVAAFGAHCEPVLASVTSLRAELAAVGRAPSGKTLGPIVIDDAVILVGVLEAARAPTLTEARPELYARLHSERRAIERRAWLDGLRQTLRLARRR